MVKTCLNYAQAKTLRAKGLNPLSADMHFLSQKELFGPNGQPVVALKNYDKNCCNHLPRELATWSASALAALLPKMKLRNSTDVDGNVVWECWAWWKDECQVSSNHPEMIDALYEVVLRLLNRGWQPTYSL